MIEFLKRHKDIYLGLLVIILAALVFGNSILVHDEIKSRDSLYHLVAVKNMTVSSELTQESEATFWGQLSQNYRPIFYYVSIGIKSIFDIDDYYVLARVTTYFIAIIAVFLFFLIAKTIFPSTIFAVVASTFLILSYYPLRRFSVFLPENLAVVFSLLLVWAYVNENLRTSLRYSLFAVSFIAIALTNILAVVFFVAAFSFLIPFHIYTRKYKEAFFILLGVSFGFAAGLSYSMFIQNDFFWLVYLKLPLLLFILLSICAIGVNIIRRQFDRIQAKKIFSSLSLIILCAIVLIVALQGTHLLSNRFWNPENFFSQIKSTYKTTFSTNDDYVLGINGLVVAMSYIGIVLLLLSKDFLKKGYLFFLLLASISFFTILVGPYFGLDPNLNTPRAMFYFSISVPILVGYCVYFFQKIMNNKFLSLLVFSVVVVTSAKYSLSIAKSYTSYVAPKEVIQYLDDHYDGKSKIYSDTMLLASIYLPTNEFDSIVYTPKNVTLEELLMNPKNYSLQFLVITPQMKSDTFSLSNEKISKSV